MTRCLHITAPCILDGFTIRNGSTAGDGGGMYIDSTPAYCNMLDFYHVPKIRNCAIQNNIGGSDGYGTAGGIYDSESNTEIENCTFEGNQADSGGGVYHFRSSITFNRCVFRENEAVASGSLGGGAIAGEYNNQNTGGLIYIINCLFHDNRADSRGGAISTNIVYPRIRNSTFFNNAAGIAGGAYHGNVNSDAPFVRNCIFWDNTPDQLDVMTTNPNWYVSQSDVQGGWTGPGEDNIDANPDFASSATGNFHLSLGSPCIDTGYRWGMPTEDLDGSLRPFDGDGDGTAAWDMGCYEFARITLPGDFDWDWDVDGRDLPGFGSGFGSHLGDYAYNASYDFDADGAIDENDLEILTDGFGQVEIP